MSYRSSHTTLQVWTETHVVSMVHVKPSVRQCNVAGDLSLKTFQETIESQLNRSDWEGLS